MSKEKSVSMAKTRNLALIALFSAIITIMTFIPYLGYIVVGPVAITTLHIPVIIGATVLGPSGGTILGAVWGITCIINAFLAPLPQNIPFQNPLISVVPRILVGLIVGLIAKAIANRSSSVAKSSFWNFIPAIIGTLTNTALVLTALNLFNTDALTATGTIKQILLTIVSINGVIELAAAVILVPAISYAINRTQKKVDKPS